MVESPLPRHEILNTKLAGHFLPRLHAVPKVMEDRGQTGGRRVGVELADHRRGPDRWRCSSKVAQLRGEGSGLLAYGIVFAEKGHGSCLLLKCGVIGLRDL